MNTNVWQSYLPVVFQINIGRTADPDSEKSLNADPDPGLPSHQKRVKA